MPLHSLIAAAFIAACEDELAAPKPGNVHVFAAGHGMEVADFVHSAQAAAPALAGAGRTGVRILRAVEATFAAVGQNTNLGIILLCTPLAVAASQAGDLRQNLGDVLNGLDIEDAENAFRAINLASPGGLGAAEHDVRAPARVTLLAAMQTAAERDMIAAQYAFGFAHVFDIGLPALAAAKEKQLGPEWTALGVYLAFLSAFPDSHIVRKYGPELAEKVRWRAVPLHSMLLLAADPALILPQILGFDAELKLAGLNPGTSADLTVATLFANRLIHMGRTA